MRLWMSWDIRTYYVIFSATILGRFLALDISKSCLDNRPHYLLDMAVNRQPQRLPPGVSLVYDVTGQVHAYRMTSSLASLSLPSDVVFDKCNYFPQNFSIFVSIKYESEPEPWKKECIVSIKLSQTRKHGRHSGQNDRPDAKNDQSNKAARQNFQHDATTKQTDNIKYTRARGNENNSSYTLRGRKTLLSLSIHRSKLVLRYKNTNNWFTLYDVFDEQWHSILVGVTEDSIVVTQDCRMRQHRKIKRPFPTMLDVSTSYIYVGCCRKMRGVTTSLLKNVILLPEADAAARACVTALKLFRPQNGSSHIDPGETTLDPLPKPAQCTWTDIGYLTYDLNLGAAKICVNGVWKPLTPPIDKKKRLDYIKEHQHIRTPAPAIDVEIFKIPGQGLFAAFANSASSTTRSKGNVKPKSKTNRFTSNGNTILNLTNTNEWSVDANTITLKEDLSTAKDVFKLKSRNEDETISRNRRASRSNKQRQRSRNTSRSVIYKLVANKFRFFQYIPSNTAQCVKFFRIGSQYFLAVANYGFNANLHTVSVIYRWDRKRCKFREFQSLVTWTARDLEYFTFEKNHYLAVANYAKRSNTNTDSVVYKWNKIKRLFEEYQRIPTIGAYDWTFLTVNGYHFLACANAFNGLSTNLFSTIYVWQNEQFIPFQTLETTGATDFEAFTIEDNMYLAVANAYNFGPQNFRDTRRYLTNSTIYRLDRRKRQFVYFQHFSTSSAIDWEYFSVDQDHFLLLSNAQHHNENESDQRSKIYRFQGVEGFVLTHKLRTLPSADWETFTHQKEVYLIYANAKGRTSQVLKVVFT